MTTIYCVFRTLNGNNIHVKMNRNVFLLEKGVWIINLTSQFQLLSQKHLSLSLKIKHKHKHNISTEKSEIKISNYVRRIRSTI